MKHYNWIHGMSSEFKIILLPYPNTFFSINFSLSCSEWSFVSWTRQWTPKHHRCYYNSLLDNYTDLHFPNGVTAGNDQLDLCWILIYTSLEEMYIAKMQEGEYYLQVLYIGVIKYDVSMKMISHGQLIQVFIKWYNIIIIFWKHWYLQYLGVSS